MKAVSRTSTYSKVQYMYIEILHLAIGILDTELGEPHFSASPRHLESFIR